MPKLIERRDGDQRLYLLDDGYDYPGLLAAYRRGEIAGTPLGGRPFHHVARLDHDGRRFVFKIQDMVYSHLDTRARLRLFGSPFLATMRKVIKARNSGFDRVQQMYLVEETVTRPAKGRVVLTATILSEYLEGSIPDIAEFLRCYPAFIGELRKHKLVGLDCIPSNTVIAGGQMKAIDLDYYSQPFILHWPRGYMNFERNYGFTPPLNSVLDRMVYRMVRGKVLLLDRLHRRVKKRPPDFM